MVKNLAKKKLTNVKKQEEIKKKSKAIKEKITNKQNTDAIDEFADFSKEVTVEELTDKEKTDEFLDRQISMLEADINKHQDIVTTLTEAVNNLIRLKEKWDYYHLPVLMAEKKETEEEK